MKKHMNKCASPCALEKILADDSFSVEISDLCAAGKVSLDDVEALGELDNSERIVRDKNAESDCAPLARHEFDSALFCQAKFSKISSLLANSLAGTTKTLKKDFLLDDFRAVVSYDGGTEIAFYGDFKECSSVREKFELIKQAGRVGTLKAQAFDFHGLSCVLLPQGARIGIGSYSYVLLVLDSDERVKYRFYLHKSPCKEIAGVRVKIEYPAFRLTTRLENVITEIRSIISECFQYETNKEIVSRLDINITSTIPMHFFNDAVEHDRIINPCRSSKIFCVGRPITSIRLGSSRGFQVAIYDKVAELTAKCDELKINDLLSVFGSEERDWSRVEFRAHREILNNLNVQSVDDWLRRESELINYLTFRWFRIGLEGRAVDRRHTLQNVIDPRWYALRYSLLFAITSRQFVITQSTASAHFKHYRTLSQATEKAIDETIPRVRRRIPRRFRIRPRRAVRQGFGFLVSSIVQMSGRRQFDDAELLSILESQCRANLERVSEVYKRKCRQYAEDYELVRIEAIR